MSHLIILIFDGAERFERWFNDRFGWFFTNGMKESAGRKPMVFRASGTRSSPR